MTGTGRCELFAAEDARRKRTTASEDAAEAEDSARELCEGKRLAVSAANNSN